jgi:hypothetical protein
MDKNIKIYIITHKKIDLPVSMKCYYPIQVGAYNKGKFFPLSDDTMDNIAQENDRFCELTAMYWIWKNALDSDYIGVCHYRRYYDLADSGVSRWFVRQYEYLWDHAFPEEAFDKINCVDHIPAMLEKHDIILPELSKIKPSVEKQYQLDHDGTDLQILYDILIKKYPEYYDAWNVIMHGKRMSIGNMFISKKEVFRQYMCWLFDILFEVKQRIPPKTDLYQNRTFGFMAERLLNIYVHHQRYSIQYVPMIFLGDRNYKVRLNLKDIIHKCK